MFAVDYFDEDSCNISGWSGVVGRELRLDLQASAGEVGLTAVIELKMDDVIMISRVTDCKGAGFGFDPFRNPVWGNRHHTLLGTGEEFRLPMVLPW